MSKQYIIHWNAGYGDEYDEVTADNEEHAGKIASERFRAACEDNADFGVECEATDETRDDYL